MQAAMRNIMAAFLCEILFRRFDCWPFDRLKDDNLSIKRLVTASAGCHPEPVEGRHYYTSQRSLLRRVPHRFPRKNNIINC